MARMTGGQALVESILGHEVETIFALPGIQLDALFNALHDAGNRVRVIHSRHEQGAAYMAFGYAASSGRTGVFTVVPGPGLLNASAALATAYACNAPVLCLTGQIPSPAIGRGLGLLHEIPDQLGVLQRLTKWARRIDHPALAPELVSEAFAEMRRGRVRPVALEMAMDVMAASAEVTLCDPAPPPPPPTPDPEAVEQAAKLLGAAERPLIMVGGGAAGAAAEVLALAEMLQAPVIAQRGGRGVVSDRHYLSQSWPAGHRLWAEADVVVAIGTRLQQARMAWGEDDALKIVRIDIDPTEINRLSKPAVGIVADAAQAVRTLVDGLTAHNRKRASRRDELEALKSEIGAELARLEPQMSYLRVIREALPDDGFLVDELTQVGYVARLGFPVYEPRHFICAGYQGTLGYGFATALGVQVAHPDRKVISINGDGGFMFTMPELATAVQNDLGVVAIVFADGAFGNVRRMQAEQYGGRLIASDLHNPDFVKLAESFGAAGYRATSPEELRGVLDQALANRGPSLIEVPIGEMPEPWHLIHMPRVRPRRR